LCHQLVVDLLRCDELRLQLARLLLQLEGDRFLLGEGPIEAGCLLIELLSETAHLADHTNIGSIYLPQVFHPCGILLIRRGEQDR
jgi:hypothetical protein